MATAEELRRAREATSIFSGLFGYIDERNRRLAEQGRRPVLGGLLSKEPVMGTDTLRYEGVLPLVAGLLEPIARGVDAPRAAAQGLIPQEDMIGEAFGTAGTAMVGGGVAAGRGILDYDPATTRVFAGPKAKTADLDALKKAKELSARRRDPDEIFRETGWFKGADNQWRFEIPDDKVEFIADPTRLPEYQLRRAAGLGDVIKHDELFAAYPEMRGLLTETGDNPTPYGGWQPFEDRSSEGLVNMEEQIRVYGPTRRDIESVLLHEIDHAVANREGFSGGTNQSEATSRILEQQNIDLYNIERRMDERTEELGLSPFEYRPDTTDPELLQLRREYDARVGRSPSNQDIFAMYQRNMGEVAARNTESRRDMTAAERRETPPRLTEDTPREAQWTEGIITSASSEPLEGFEGYLSRVNPSGKRIAAEDRPNLMMGDMYGMLPRGSDIVGERGDVTFHRSPDGDYYATAYNPDVGEQDVVGYITDRGDSTELQVVAEMQGQGIGGELQYLFRSENPDAPTGGLTEAGERSLERTYDRLFDEGLVPANASKSAGLLSVASDVSDRGDQILNMLKSGKGSEVTDAMLDMGDSVKNTQLNQYLAENYDLPMDEASRLARAREMGLLDTAYHSTGRDFQNFVPSEFRGASFFAATPEGASKGASASANEGVGSGSKITMPVRVDTSGVEGLGAYARKDMNEFRASLPDRIYTEAEVDALMASDAAPLRGNWNDFFDDLTDYDALRKFRDENPTKEIPDGIVKFRPKRPKSYNKDLKTDLSGRQFAHYSEGMSERPTSEYVKSQGNTGFTMMDESGLALAMVDPTKVRSQFARFDPRLSHLSNVTAANASPISGLLAQSGVSSEQAQMIEDYLNKTGLLQ